MLINLSCSKKEESTLEDSSLKNEQISALFTTTKGNFYVEFFPTKAPHTVKRIIELIEKNFFNNMNFHRVIPNYIIQTGDATTTGVGGSGKMLPFEINDLQHIRGSLAMARFYNDLNSADSQFYISLTTLPHLDGKFSIFGQVREGLEILDSITPDDKILSIQLHHN